MHCFRFFSRSNNIMIFQCPELKMLYLLNNLLNNITKRNCLVIDIKHFA